MTYGVHRVQLNVHYDFVGWLPDSDKAWRSVLFGKRFILLNEDHPPRVVAADEMKERREPRTDPPIIPDDGA